LAEQLEHISEQLKTAREKSGIELEQIASQTFIPLRLLKAMDEGKFERLPEPVFIQGFIRRYGDAVGLDGRKLSQEFIIQPPTLKKPAKEYLSYHPEDDTAVVPRSARKSPLAVPEPLPADTAPPAAAPSAVPDSTPVAAPLMVPPPGETPAPIAMPSPAGDATRPSPHDDNKSLIYWVGGLAALVLIVMGVIATMQPKSGSDVNKAGNSSSNAVASPQTSPTKATSPLPQTSPAAAPLTLTIKVNSDSWVEVITDGQVAISETLPQGTEKTWTAQKNLSITSGNAQGVTFSYNQSPMKPMGTTANPQTLVFPPPPTP
jgi:cytoskeletal protein RodZ